MVHVGMIGVVSKEVEVTVDMNDRTLLQSPRSQRIALGIPRLNFEHRKVHLYLHGGKMGMAVYEYDRREVGGNGVWMYGWMCANFLLQTFFNITITKSFNFFLAKLAQLLFSYYSI